MDIAKLLEPVSAQQPAGRDLYYEREFDEIREARRQDDTAPMGLWEREIKNADYKLAAQKAEEALTLKTKDLRIAVWLGEARIYLDGAPGLVAGIDLLQGMLEKFWPDLYPEIGDLETRASPLEWFGSYFDPAKGSSPKLAVCRIPLVMGKYDFFTYQESRKVGSENDVKDNELRKAARLELIAEGKVSAEVFDKEFEQTPKAFYKQLAADYKQALESLARLDAWCRENFKEAAPSFRALRVAIEEISNSVHILLLRKLKTDPDAPDSAPKPPPAGVESSAAVSIRPTSAPNLAKLSGGPIGSEEEAVLHILAAAQFIRSAHPSTPLSYLLLRALRWGEVRAAVKIAAAELVAPSGEIRVALRASATAGDWHQVLEVAETAMSESTGRGWLDLQRYSVKACDELGYSAAAKALRSELKCFLADFPELPQAILNDDTGTANPETLAWLEKEGLLPPAAPPES